MDLTYSGVSYYAIPDYRTHQAPGVVIPPPIKPITHYPPFTASKPIAHSWRLWAWCLRSWVLGIVFWVTPPPIKPTTHYPPLTASSPSPTARGSGLDACGRGFWVRRRPNRCRDTSERRAQRRHPVYTAPELLATAPNQLWSWDITKLMGPTTWSWSHLYVILDVFSRYVVGWMVAPRESALLAERLIAACCAREQIGPNQLTLHADRSRKRSARHSRIARISPRALGRSKTPACAADRRVDQSPQIATVRGRRSVNSTHPVSQNH